MTAPAASVKITPMTIRLSVPWNTHTPPLIGDPGTMLVHDSSCPEVLNLVEGVAFDPATLAEARRMGFSPCSVCLTTVGFKQSRHRR